MSQRKEVNSPNPPPAIEEHGRSGASLLRVGLDPIGCSGFDSVAGAERQAERIYPGSTTSWSDSHFSEAEVTEYLDELWKDSQCSFCGKTPDETGAAIFHEGYRCDLFGVCGGILRCARRNSTQRKLAAFPDEHSAEGFVISAAATREEALGPIHSRPP